MDIQLDEKEARVLGCLMEKQMATPEYYPLSLNALTNACNQKTNREPVTAYDENTVEAVLDGLIQKGWVNKSVVGRVPKYEELFIGKHNMVPREAAVICVLLLRGPQTVGEIRTRTTRMFDFPTIEAVGETLAQLEGWGMVRRLERLPGHKESRYQHLLAGNSIEELEPAGTEPRAGDTVDDTRLAQLEEEVRTLRQELVQLKNELAEFKQQFA